jgi:hypothetical protein
LLESCSPCLPRFAKRISPATAGAGILQTGSLTIWGGAELIPMAHLAFLTVFWHRLFPFRHGACGTRRKLGLGPDQSFTGSVACAFLGISCTSFDMGGGFSDLISCECTGEFSLHCAFVTTSHGGVNIQFR